MAALGFGVKKQRLVAIWKSVGRDKTYKDVATLYKKEFPAKDEQPADQTIGNARAEAFGIEPKKRVTGPKEPSTVEMTAVLRLLVSNSQDAGDLLTKLKETPVNPFEAYDKAASNRDFLVKILEQIDSAKRPADLV